MTSPSPFSPTRWWRLLAALSAGVATVGAFAPFGWGLLAVLGPAGLFSLLWDSSPRRAFLLGWLYGVGLMGFGVFWLRISIAQFGGVTLPLAWFVTLAFALLMALYYGAVAALGVRLGGGRRQVTALLTLPGCWVLGEWLRGWVLSGFPWLALGYSQIDLPSVGLAPVLGVYGATLLVVLTAGALVRARQLWPPLLVGVLWLASAVLGRVEWGRSVGEPFPVTIIQGNVAQTLKWQPEQLRPTIALYEGLTLAAADSRLVIWPETAIPAFAHQVEDALLRPLHALARERGQDVLLGIAVSEAGGGYYNALLNVGSSGRSSYYKRQLVPFGEFMPLRPLLEPLIDVFAIPMSDFSAGRAEPVLPTAGYVAGASICYEDAFGAQVIEALPQAALLVNVSNDAWFGDSLAPHQHLEIARMRAVESDRYLLRATNTGVSAIIGPDGALREVAPQFERAVLTGTVQPRSGATPYVRWGNAAVVVLSFLLSAAGAWLGWLARARRTL